MAWDSPLRFSNTIPKTESGEVSSDPVQDGSFDNESKGSKEKVPEYVDCTSRPLPEQQEKQQSKYFMILHAMLLTISRTDIHWIIVEDYSIVYLDDTARLWRFTFQRAASRGTVGTRSIKEECTATFPHDSRVPPRTTKTTTLYEQRISIRNHVGSLCYAGWYSSRLRIS